MDVVSGVRKDIELGQGVSGMRWRVREQNRSMVDQVREATREPEAVVRCLLNRGISDPEMIGRFLAPDFSRHRHDPMLLRDMGRAVERLHRAVREKERILIVTDFDVDGTTSSVILSQALKLLGGPDLTTAYIPDRFTEGYGLSTKIVERAATEGFGLILTADIGIKSHEEARLAARLGIDLIICDHHLPDGEDIPADAYAVLCPKGSSGLDYPNKHLAACGVALKLADALLIGHPRREAIVASLSKLTAIGTIADMVDLLDTENRAIVTHGLRGLSERSNNPGLRALLELAQVGEPITTYDIGFKIGPRINAAGRIAHANSVLALFDAKTDEEAVKLATTLDELNSERQNIQRDLIEQVKTMIPYDADGNVSDRVILLAGSEADGFHRGVVGIACSKIVELTGRPTLICAINEEGMAHGSGRSIDGFHIVEALDTVSDLLVKYGGHPMAAGFTVSADRVEEMRWRLNRHADEVLPIERLGRVIVADAEIPLQDVNPGLIRRLMQLEPHGIGNPPPAFYLPQVVIQSVKVLKEKHLKLTLGIASPASGPALSPPSGQSLCPALWWNSSEHLPAIEEAIRDSRTVSLMGRLEINSWLNRQTAQIKLLDVRID